MAAPETIDIKLAELERTLNKLHVLFEQHFCGILKRQPAKEREDFQKTFASIARSELKTTSAKFRFQTLQARYIQLQRLWEKTLKEIEEGTYKRDLFLLQKKLTVNSQTSPAPENASGKNAISSTPSPAQPPISPEILEHLYEKVKAGSSHLAKVLSKETFMSSLQREIEKHQKKNPGKPIAISLKKDPAGQMQVRIGLKKTSAKAK